MANKTLRAGLIIFAVFLLCCAAGCSFFKKDQMVRNSPEALYIRGSAEFQDGSYKKAREFFIRLKDEYPLHNLAILAELGIADSFFTDKEYPEAENAYREFLNMHPTNEHIPYVLYQLGMCHYSLKGTIDRDQTETIKASKEFERLIARFPENKFSLAAGKYLRECKQDLAEQEFYVGQFYFRQKKYSAALNRFETIARNYANLGLDYKIEYYIGETKRKLAEEEKLKQAAAEKLKQKATKK
ncbi:MAG: outer membrane protein assembly factor BamD [Deltaproteobacteria bacterium HGW-Deltaproteobacteria-12]|jgi:outer membrane protein assembly factor BamD|nr:MAG: outer membrane protein assembly factor BamD [Deltaproteobacteria bacterium HGW-Deltaproteobacteria-12]